MGKGRCQGLGVAFATGGGRTRGAVVSREVGDVAVTFTVVGLGGLSDADGLLGWIGNVVTKAHCEMVM